MKKKIFSYASLVFDAFISAVGINIFLIPHKLLSGGVTGISMIGSYFTPLSVSLIYFALNVPLMIAGWFIVGKRFILFSVISIVSTTIFLQFIPVKLVTIDPLLSAVYAGALIGAGGGFSFRAGGSSGGFDILGAIISKSKDLPIGNIIICLNAVVIMTAGYVTGDWNIALNSAICIFVSGKVFNFIYPGHEKVTVNINTDRADDMVEALFQLHQRGITKLSSKGAYSDERREMLVTVVTRYELVEVKEAIRRVDPRAFVNITQTVEVMGNFRKKTA